jgi:hypothetical protein
VNSRSLAVLAQSRQSTRVSSSDSTGLVMPGLIQLRAAPRARRAARERHLRAGAGRRERLPHRGVITLVGRKLGGHAGEYGLAPGIAGAAKVFGALVIARPHLRDLARTAVLAWVLLGAFRFPLGLATSPLFAAGLLAVTSFASALTDVPLIALVQQRIPDRHLAKALGLWEAGMLRYRGRARDRHNHHR